MRTARVLALATVAGLTLSVGCNTKQPVESTTPATASDPVAPPAAEKDPMAGATRTNPVEKVEIFASFEGLEDMIVAGKDLSARIEGEDGGDPIAEIQAMLLAQGFGPAFLKNINLDGLHALKIAFPADDDANPNDIDLSAALAVVDGRKVLESMPSSMRPQPLGGDVWEMRQEDETFLIKEAGKELLWGRSQGDVDKAVGLTKEAGPGRRVRVKAWNIPADDVDPAELLGLPSDGPMMKEVSEILKELNAAELQLDFGSKKQLELVATAEAPFSKLGLDPIGNPRKKATGLEARLPAGAVFVTSLSYGDPKMVNKTLDAAIPMDQIPAPFDAIVKEAVDGTHMILNSVGKNVVFALYLDSKGQATVVLAAGLKKKKQDKTAKGLRKIHGAAATALEAHAALQGKNKDAKFIVSFKEDGLKFSGVKADQMTVKVPKDFMGEMDEAAIFLKKNSIETVSFVEDGVAIWAAGAGSRGLASDIAKSLSKDRTTSMATEGNLETLRKGMDGCQVCMTFDGTAYLRLRLMHLASTTDDKAVAKKVKAHLAKLKKLKADVDVSMGVRVSDNNGAFGVVVPTATLGLSKETIASFKEIVEFVDGDGSSSAEVSTKPAAIKAK